MITIIIITPLTILTDAVELAAIMRVPVLTQPSSLFIGVRIMIVIIMILVILIMMTRIATKMVMLITMMIDLCSNLHRMTSKCDY